MACQDLPVPVSNLNNECDHPDKPVKPYTDEKAGLFIAAQGKKIDVCRALLGNMNGK